jgi:thiamine kinase-like enzyme
MNLQKKQFDLLKLDEIVGQPSHIRKTTGGLLFKKERSENKAMQEYLATKTARSVLPNSLRIPKVWGVYKDCLVSTYYTNGQFSKDSKKEVYQAADYLIKMHETKVSNELRDKLIESSNCHYWGESLKSRLKQELYFSIRAFRKTLSIQAYLIILEAIVESCLEIENSFPVLGHGDFHAKNLLYFENTIIPVDWVDFGVCDRSYEVHHFVNSISKHLRDEIYLYYTAKTKTPKDALNRGIGIDAIIQAGNRARLVIFGEKNASDEEIQAQFVSQIKRGSAILNS